MDDEDDVRSNIFFVALTQLAVGFEACVEAILGSNAAVGN